jgi:hypothetical protein
MAIYSLLVIEDNSHYQDVAKKAFSAIQGIAISYASTYEDALPILHHKPDAVITDLFFPAKISVRENYIKIGKTLGLIPFDWDNPRYDRINMDATAKNFAETFVNWPGHNSLIPGSESFIEPSGILVLEYCFDNNITPIVVSQGDRHKGDFGRVRYFLDYLIVSLHLKLPSADQINACNPLSMKFLLREMSIFSYCLYQGEGVDKSQQETWIDALKELYYRHSQY